MGCVFCVFRVGFEVVVDVTTTSAMSFSMHILNCPVIVMLGTAETVPADMPEDILALAPRDAMRHGLQLIQQEGTMPVSKLKVSSCSHIL